MKVSKEHKPQQSRVIQNIKTIQKYMGRDDSTIICNARIKYSYKKGKRNTTEIVKGEGGSDTNTINDVNTIFTNYGLMSLANIPRANGGNLPGQCAEPHAVADALRQIDIKERFIINQIVVDEAKINNLTNSLRNQGKRLGDVMPRCATCKQWVPNKHVIEIYLK